MADPNENNADNFGDLTVEDGGAGLDADAAGAAVAADLSDDTAGAAAETEAVDDLDGESMADKADLIDADSILDPVPTEGGDTADESEAQPS